MEKEIQKFKIKKSRNYNNKKMRIKKKKEK